MNGLAVTGGGGWKVLALRNSILSRNRTKAACPLFFGSQIHCKMLREMYG